MGKSECSLLTVRQAAEQLSVTEAAIRRWLLERRIASVKVGRRLVRIPATEVQRLVEAGLRPARPERQRSGSL
jgi:excisionase family DNA binding protein